MFRDPDDGRDATELIEEAFYAPGKMGLYTTPEVSISVPRCGVDSVPDKNSLFVDTKGLAFEVVYVDGEGLAIRVYKKAPMFLPQEMKERLGIE